MSSHLLELGSLILSSGEDIGPTPGANYEFDVMGEDFATGDAEPIERTLRSLLQDGAVTITDGYSNRTAQFRVTITAPNSLILAQGEAALVAELGKPNLLSWTPPDGWGPASVFEVFTSSMSHVPDDLGEVLNLERTYVVRLVCHPSVRSANPVTTLAVSMPPGESPTPVTTTISAASATTNWTARIGVLSDAGSMLQVAGSRSPRVRYSSGSVDFSATPYITLVMYRVKNTEPTAKAVLAVPPTLTVDGQVAELVAAQPSGGEVRYYWRSPVASGTLLEFGTDFPSVGKFAAFTSLRFYSLQRTNVPPISGTSRQKARTVEVAGSTRTQGSLVIEHETTGLGMVLAYTWPAVAATYSPALRPYRLSGGTLTGDANLISGARDLLDTTVVYEIPTRDLNAGTHLLMARLRSDTVSAQSLTYSAQVYIGGSAIGSATVGFATHNFGSIETWRNVVLGRLMLPPTDVQLDSSATVRVTIAATTSSASDIDIDEAWLFNTTIGDLTWVECGTGAATAGGSSNRLWISTATTDLPRPSIFRGFSADGSDSYSAGSSILSFGRHEFVPPLMNVFIATSGAQDASASWTHYPRWHSHAAL